MTIDSTIVAAALTALGLIVTGIWALNKHIEWRFETARQSADKAVGEARKAVDDDIADLQHKLDELRNECARRDDLHDIKEALRGLGGRIDDIHLMLSRRGETA